MCAKKTRIYVLALQSCSIALRLLGRGHGERAACSRLAAPTPGGTIRRLLLSHPFFRSRLRACSRRSPRRPILIPLCGSEMPVLRRERSCGTAILAVEGWRLWSVGDGRTSRRPCYARTLAGRLAAFHTIPMLPPVICHNDQSCLHLPLRWLWEDRAHLTSLVSMGCETLYRGVGPGTVWPVACPKCTMRGTSGPRNPSSDGLGVGDNGNRTNRDSQPPSKSQAQRSVAESSFRNPGRIT
jgi:hypothetical protein